MTLMTKILRRANILMAPADGDGNDLPGTSGQEKIAAGLEADKTAEKAKQESDAAAEAEAQRQRDEQQQQQRRQTSDEEARLLKEVMKRKENEKNLSAQVSDLTSKLSAFDGIDVEQVKALLNAQKSAEDAELEKKGEWDRLKSRMADEHSKELEKIRGELGGQVTSLSEQLAKANGTITELSVGNTFGQSKFISEELVLTPAKARVVYGDHFDLEDGKLVGYDKPRGAANRTALVDGSGEAVAFDAALRKIIESDPDKDSLLKSTVRPGSGSDNKVLTQGKRQPQKEEKFGAEKIAAGLASLKVS